MSAMSSGDEAPALADVDLVQQCIEGNEEAIAELKRTKFWLSSGAIVSSARARSFTFSTADQH
jgi:hypothetical protein